MAGPADSGSFPFPHQAATSDAPKAARGIGAPATIPVGCGAMPATGIIFTARHESPPWNDARGIGARPEPALEDATRPPEGRTPSADSKGVNPTG